MKDNGEEGRRGAFSSTLEVVASALGLLLAVGVLGFIGWEAFHEGGSMPPSIEVHATRILPSGNGYVVEVKASNHSEATAAAVQIEGGLKRAGQSVEKSNATISYVPGKSEREAGLFFTEDPRKGRLEVRAVGYEKP